MTYSAAEPEPANDPISPASTLGEEPLTDYIARYSNWGRWGSDDQRGTSNLIIPSMVRDACRAVGYGTVVPIGLELSPDGPQSGANGRFNCLRYQVATGTDHILQKQTWSGRPIPREMGYSDDVVIFPLQAATHWDSLSHIFHRGKMYNDVPASEATAGGTSRNGVEQLAGKLVGHGVLLDVPAAKGLSWLDDGYAITIDDLDEAAEHGKIVVSEGDIVLLRTGQLARCREQGWNDYAGGDAPGLSFSAIPWLFESGIAAVATDTWGVEVRPNELPDSFQPLHIVAVVYMGLLLGEMFDLDSLATICAEAQRYDFLVAASPIAFTGTAGAPPGPVVII